MWGCSDFRLEYWSVVIHVISGKHFHSESACAGFIAGSIITI